MVAGVENINCLRFQDVNDKAVKFHHQTLSSDILFGNHPGRPGGALYRMRKGQRSVCTDLDEGRLSNIESGLEVSRTGCVENDAPPLARSLHNGPGITRASQMLSAGKNLSTFHISDRDPATSHQRPDHLGITGNNSYSKCCAHDGPRIAETLAGYWLLVTGCW